MTDADETIALRATVIGGKRWALDMVAGGAIISCSSIRT
jgi:hypothetical protein